MMTFPSLVKKFLIGCFKLFLVGVVIVPASYLAYKMYGPAEGWHLYSVNGVSMYMPPWSVPYNKKREGQVDTLQTYGVLPNFDLWDEGLSHTVYS
ncbi:MAG: hypothetical protein JKX94_06210, partial [Sneathiella sp.]|nr:hypothetical protein [Sneathiella sp.]